MDTSKALLAFGALSQPTRLAAVRLLVRAGCDGLPAGEISAHLEVRHNLLSNHLNILSGAGLVTSRREGRSIIYTADYSTLRGLLGFLITDCCSGLPEIVGDLDLQI